MPEPRPVHQSRLAARTHTHMLGPTGTGKTSLLVSLALDDLRQGVSVAPWVDPKDGKGCDALLARIPRQLWDRVVLFDPGRLDYAVGLNVLECDSPERRDIVVDQVIAVFEQLFSDVWGRRQAEVMQAGLMTLMHNEGTTLPDLVRLLTTPEHRRHWTRQLEDRDLVAYWLRYDAMSEAQQGAYVGTLLSRLQSLLLRPRVRTVLGQQRSTVDLADILDHGGIVLARLPLELGLTSRLLGSFLFLRIWQVVQGRQSLPEEQLRDAAAYLDEGELFMHIRGSVADVFDQARSLRWGIIFAHQRLGQLSERGPELYDAISANARTKVVFQPSPEDAKAMAASLTPLEAPDLLRLGTRQVAVKLPDSRPFVGRTPELPPPSQQPTELADHALRRWGRSREEVEAELNGGRRRRPEPVPWA